jgi:hypothetical protein
VTHENSDQADLRPAELQKASRRHDRCLQIAHAPQRILQMRPLQRTSQNHTATTTMGDGTLKRPYEEQADQIVALISQSLDAEQSKLIRAGDLMCVQILDLQALIKDRDDALTRIAELELAKP